MRQEPLFAYSRFLPPLGDPSRTRVVCFGPVELFPEIREIFTNRDEMFEGAEEGPEGNPDSILLQLFALFLNIIPVEYSGSSDALYAKFSPVRRSIERIYSETFSTEKEIRNHTQPEDTLKDKDKVLLVKI